MFLMGFAQEAYKLWILSKVFQQFVPRKIVAPPSQEIRVSESVLNSSSANVRVTTPTLAASTVPSIYVEALVSGES
jgi:hypothetical protein